MPFYGGLGTVRSDLKNKEIYYDKRYRLWIKKRTSTSEKETKEMIAFLNKIDELKKAVISYAKEHQKCTGAGFIVGLIIGLCL